MKVTMKKLNYIKPTINCFPYEDNIEFALGSDPKKHNKLEFKPVAPGNKDLTNDKTEYDW